MREVHVTSIGVPFNTPEDQVIPVIELEAERSPDLIVLPEVWISQAERPPGSIENAVVHRVREIARTKDVNIVYPLDHVYEGKRRNSSIFIARTGEISAQYDKIYPYWSELTLPRAVDPGERITVVDADFGRIGLAICFDVNFPHIWQEFADRDVEVVVWMSAYSAGSSLQAHALNHHYYIVTATQHPDSALIDITGQEIRYETGKGVFASRATLDLDRCIFHENFNLEKLNRLTEEHAGEVRLESHLAREQWFVLSATRPGASARQLAAEYGMEELRHYKKRSRVEIDRLRFATVR